MSKYIKNLCQVKDKIFGYYIWKRFNYVCVYLYFVAFNFFSWYILVNQNYTYKQRA